MGVNSLPKTVTRQHHGCDLNPGPSAPESSTLTTRLPSHPRTAKPIFRRKIAPRMLSADQHISRSDLHLGGVMTRAAGGVTRSPVARVAADGGMASEMRVRFRSDDQLNSIRRHRHRQGIQLYGPRCGARGPRPRHSGLDTCRTRHSQVGLLRPFMQRTDICPPSSRCVR